MRAAKLAVFMLEILESARLAHAHGDFFACQGPDAPPRDMATTAVCRTAWRARCWLIANGHPIYAATGGEQ